MEDFGLVSIVCPMFNCQDFILETIESVLNQTYSNFELLIVDDLSTDKSVEIVQSVKDERIKLFTKDHNGGAAESRNIALKNAKGKWIAFLDSDDLWMNCKLEKQLKFMIDNNYHYSFTEYIHIDENSNQLGTIVKGPKKVTKHKMNNFCYMGCLTVMYEASDEVIQIDPRIKKRNDYAIWLKVIKNFNAYMLQEPLAKYRKRNGSISNVSIKKLIKAHYTLFRVSENKNFFFSWIHVVRNLWFGFWKKRIYVKKYKVGDLDV